MKVKYLKELIKEQIRIIIENTNPNINSNFKRWFGNSKVVNRSGKPLIVYHGTNIEFEKFDSTKSRSGWLSAGFYFTSNKTEAKDYGRNIIVVYLSLKNPFIIKSDTIKDDGTVEWAKSTKEQLIEKFPSIKNMEWKDVSRFLINKGYDGIIHTDNLICVFHPNSIKSINNDGSWDLNDDNIYS